MAFKVVMEAKKRECVENTSTFTYLSPEETHHFCSHCIGKNNSDGSTKTKENWEK